MNLVFHGANAANFRPGIENYLTGSHHISLLSDALSEEAEQYAFRTAEVIIGAVLSAQHPKPEQARLYQVAGAGYDGIDFSRLPAGCALCNCFGHEDAIAEYVTAALLTRYVPLAEADGQLRQGNWHYSAGRPSGLRHECGEGAIGLLGYGHIGRAVARRTKAFQMEVHVANRSPLAADEWVDHYYPLSRLESFYRNVDIVVVSLPLSQETSGLVNRKAFRAMREDSLIINVGRGQVIDEEALYEALEKELIGGAIIDTWYVYPKDTDEVVHPANLPFHTLSNVIITPHMSGWTWGTIRRRQQLIAENIRRLAEGETMRNLLHRAEK